MSHSGGNLTEGAREGENNSLNGNKNHTVKYNIGQGKYGTGVR